MTHTLATIRPHTTHTGYRARCTCRWTSSYYPNPTNARHAHTRHAQQATQR